MATPPPGGITPQPMAPPLAAPPTIEHQESAPAPEGFVLTSPMLHAQEAMTESEIEKTARKSRALSFIIAAAIHGVIAALVGLVVVANYDREAPEIIALPGESTIADDVQVKTLQPVQQQKPSAASSQVSQIISSNAASPIAVPVVEDIFTDDVMGLSATITDDIGSNPFGGGGNFSSFLPPVMTSRCTHKDREARLAESGGMPESEDAVVKGLNYIKSQQNKDGSFGKNNKIGMTGLALLAYLGHCETPDSAEFGDSCLEAILFLVEYATKNEGKLYKKGRAHEVYEHAIGTYALAEAYSITKFGKRKIPRIRQVLEMAVPIIIEGQQQNGSWDYSYASFEKSQRWDISVAGWQIQALKAAQHTKLDFPGINASMDLAIKHLKEKQTSNGSFPYANAEARKTGRPAMTGVGALGIIIGTGNPKDRAARKAVKQILDVTKFNWKSDSNEESIYGWYYATQACFQVGGASWRKWNRGFQKVLLQQQKNNGSWKPDGSGKPGAGGNAARSYAAGTPDADLYRTALCCLMLEVYYRYLPATETDAPRD